MKGQKFNGAASKARNDGNGFKTDADIAGAKFRERELQKWEPEEADMPQSLTLEDDGKGWDQFKVNEDKFGVESTYDEHLYTTRINTEAEDYHERVKRAEQLAREIENEVTNDPHILEERGKIDDSGLDEEDKYSGVDRTVDSKPKDTRGDELMAALKSVNLNDKKYVPPKPKAMNNNHRDPAIVSTESKRPDSIPSKPPQPVSHQQSSPSNPHNESFRLNAQSEINSLREFSATFKVPHRIPNDMLPMLSKGKSRDQTSPRADSATSSSQSPVPTKKKMDPTKPAFKLNPKAAAFTPSKPATTQVSPKTQPKLSANNNSNNNSHGHHGHNSHSHSFSHNRSPNNPSPRMNNNQRPYSSTSSSSNNMKRHYQISPADFFGGSEKIPTKESQVEKSKKFKVSFNLFVTTKAKTAKDQPVVVEKAFTTPPTWDQTIDEPHTSLFPQPDVSKIPMSIMPSPFIQSQMMGSPNYPATASGKFPLSPHLNQLLPQMPPPTMPNQGRQPPQQQPGTPQQQPPIPSHQLQQQAMAAQAAMFQQQQFQAAMMYQQQYGMMMPGQPPMPGMYGAEGFLPPTGYMPPPMNYGTGSPNSPHTMMNSPYSGPSPHQNSYSGHRRYQKRNNQ